MRATNGYLENQGSAWFLQLKSESCSKPSHRRSLEICWVGWPWVWPMMGFPKDPVSSQYLSLLGLTEAQKDPTGLFWDRQLSFWNNFFLVTFPLPSTLYLPQCQLWLSGNGDVCPVETSWDHIWILKHRYFLLCKVRPFFFLGIFRHQTVNSIFTSSCTLSSVEPSIPSPLLLFPDLYLQGFST